ncbi:Sn1-specific diacylglycerol lipase alpha like protein [Argiope bruennichi]|uniref:sn-1-specific diacylglycerol lipase n=1 Tax=Argiope bruennichi TaxID=94029 RepID=A0A8T0FRC9_ARGBR|nr:Sn1-specific diacylglycerol lipase alpha like protein [Argiope bruennichi]
MPALNFLGRKWLVACDDFVVPAGIDACLRIIWLTGTVAFLWLKINNCEESVYNNYFLYAAAVDLVFTSCVSLGLMFASARGSVLEVEKRKGVPILLFIKLITLLCDAIIASYGIWLLFQMNKTCIAQEVFIKATSILTLIYIFIIIVGVLVCYDTLGASKYWNIKANSNSLNFFKKAQYIWRLRLKLFCCCADISEGNDFIYVEISTFLSSFLNGIDLVPTDILSGIITLSQKHVLERRKHMMKHLPESVKMLESTSVPDWMTAENAIHFLRIAKSTYGWMAFFDVFHPWNLCVLAPQIGCCLQCGSQSDETKVDNCCYLNFAAVQKISSFSESDIVFASFKNGIHEPAFYVAVNHARKYVVIAIRGTRSFSDLLTDIDAETLYFPLEGKHKFKCHRGALRSALYLQNKLDELNILERAFSENPTYSLALTGHSLGGSIASILALLLRPKYPDLQCYAYGPMANLSSLGVVETLESVLTVVIGEDMAPRLSASSCNELRKQLIDSLRETDTPKYKILAGACWYHIQKYFKMQYQKHESCGHENQLFTNEAENISHPDADVFLDESKLYAPGRILYFERKVWDKPFWLTGLNLQNIIINPDMISDHQPHRIQHALNMYLKSVQEESHIVVI